jgi:hypothetical protein
MAKKHSKSHTLYGYYVRLDSLVDLARLSISIGSGGVHIDAIRQGKGYRLFKEGEKLEDTRLIYCVDVDSKDNVLVYNPSTDDEECMFKDSIPSNAEDYRKYKLPVLEITGKFVYTPRDKLSDHVPLVAVKGLDSFVRSIVTDTSGRTENIKLYSFFHNKQHVVGTFMSFKEGLRVFEYAVSDAKEKFSYLRYNYLSDSVEPCKNVAEKSMIYIKVINLAEPFPFFKSTK